jgi:general secretion pathway protein K
MKRWRGVALITALLVTALAGTVAANMAWDNALDWRRTMVMLYRDQAVQVAVGSEGWVQTILRDDLASSQNDHLEEVWATDIPALPIDSDAVQGQIWGEIEDLQGRFNINNLVSGNEVNEPALRQFERLLSILGLDPTLADAVVDWLDNGQQERIPGGAEDPLYSGLIPAYRTGDRPLLNVTELAAVVGMDRASFEILQPHVTALPGYQPVNVNTAGIPVLQSLNDNLTEADAEAIMGMREGGGILDVSDALGAIVDPELLQAGISDTTSFFQLKAVVQIDTVRVSLFTVMYRDAQGNVTPVLRSLGTI